MPAIAIMILQAVQAGMTLTPEIIAAVGEIVNLIQSPGVPTAAQWTTLDAAVASIMKQQGAIIANKGEMPVVTPVTTPTA